MNLNTETSDKVSLDIAAAARSSRLSHASQPYFWMIVAILLVFGAFVQFTAALGESQTWDEADHLSAGYSYLRTGDFTLNKEHPPLGKILMAFPLLFTTVAMPAIPTDFTYASETAFSEAFLYRNRTPADTLLLRARTVAILLTFALGLALALWTRTAFGPEAALLAVLLFIFDPNVLAHGRYVTTDIVVTLTMFIACLMWARFLHRPNALSLCLAGVAVGFAFLSKFSAIVLPLILLALYLVRWWQQKGQDRGFVLPQHRLSLGHLLRSSLLIALVSFITIYAGYAFQTKTLSSQSSFFSQMSGSQGGRGTPGKLTQAAVWTAKQVPIPAGPWFLGLLSVLKDSKVGRPLFLAGHSYSTGQWFYFPAVFAMKTPLGTLALLLVACTLAIWRIAQRSSDRLRWLRSLDFRWYLATIPPAVFLAVSMRSHVNIGLRHVLPVYPFLFAFIAGSLISALAAKRRVWLQCAIVLSCAALAFESLSIYPHHLAFLNYAFGGPANDVNYVSNSDVDWGQDAKGLAEYLTKHNIKQACVAYAGEADLHYYGIYGRPLPTSQEVLTSRVPDCFVAVSVSNLNARGRLYRWLDRYQPTVKVGYSIYLYDLRQTQ